MRLSDLQPGNLFRLSSLPVTTFMLVNPRLHLFNSLGDVKFAYISWDNHQLYGSPYDYEVVPIENFEIRRIK